MSRATVEGSLRLDVREFQRKGQLESATLGTWSWSANGERVASLLFEGGTDALRLSYESNGTAVREKISLSWLPCRYGGRRPLFRCPGCDRRCAIVHGGPRFLCRRCKGLNYETQHRRLTWRLQLKAERIYKRLGCNLYEGELVKPPRMHWRTFNRLAEQAEAANSQSWVTGMAKFEKSIRRLDRWRR
jgi:hypothetical protein